MEIKDFCIKNNILLEKLKDHDFKNIPHVSYFCTEYDDLLEFITMYQCNKCKFYAYSYCDSLYVFTENTFIPNGYHNLVDISNRSFGILENVFTKLLTCEQNIIKSIVE